MIWMHMAREMEAIGLRVAVSEVMGLFLKADSGRAISKRQADDQILSH